MNSEIYAIEAHRISKRFPNPHSEKPSEKNVFSDFSLTLKSGRTLAILGPSGCGKSSLLRIFAGLEQADRGEVKIYAVPPLPKTKAGEISVIASDNTLLPWRSALRNVSLSLDLLGVRRDIAHAKSTEFLEAIRIQPVDWSRRPHQLSEGQRQRIRLAQALVTEPQLLLLDEPFSNVDEGLRRVLIKIVLNHLSGSEERSAVLVTHHAYEAAALADEIIILSGEPVTEHYRTSLCVAPNNRTSTYLHEVVDEIAKRMVALADTFGSISKQ